MTNLWQEGYCETYNSKFVRKPWEGSYGQCLSILPSFKVILNSFLNFVLVGFPNLISSPVSYNENHILKRL